jgi:hypothetical protein
MGRTKNRKSVIHIGTLRALEQMTEKGEPMREKLIELIRKADKEDYDSLTMDEHYAYMADYLLAAGLILPDGEIDFDYNAEDVWK